MANTLKPGARRLFTYPREYPRSADSVGVRGGFIAHSGQVVEVVRLLSDSEYDFEGDHMYECRADDGWTGHIWRSELGDKAERKQREAA